MIELDHPETIPKEIKELVRDYYDHLPPDVEQILSSNEQRKPSLLEDKVKKEYQLLDDVCKILHGEEILVFHATRNEREAIEREGIKCIRWDWYSENLRNKLIEHGVAPQKAEDAIEIVKKAFYSKYREDQDSICVFDTYAGRGDYAYYQEMYGGEVARGALENTMPDMLPILENIGTPFVVAIKIPFDRICDHHKEAFACKIITYFLLEFIDNSERTFNFDYHVFGDISPEEIVEIKY